MPVGDEIYAEVDGEKVRVNQSDAKIVLADLTDESNPSVGRDAGGRTRVSQITTLGDYKILNSDRPLLIETVGNGSGTYSASKYNMHVGVGQYLIRQSKKFHPYFSGKGQMVEETFDTFALQTGVVKRVGYFSSSPTGTYSTAYDGFWLESNGVSGTYYMMAQRSGVETVSVPWTQWNNYEKLADYDWNNFTVTLQDFLWLGGAALNLSIKVGGTFLLAHSVNYAGTTPDVFITSPNQPMRYEIRGISGAGDFRYICAQVATEGSIDESGMSRAVDNGHAGVSLATIGTTYPIVAIRKQASQRDIAVAIEDLFLFVTSANDSIRWTLQLNPTLSAPLTYSAVANSAVESANGNGTITVTSQGTLIASGVISTNIGLPTASLKKNFLSFLGSTINNTMDALVLCGTPVTSGITGFGGIAYKEY